MTKTTMKTLCIMMLGLVVCGCASLMQGPENWVGRPVSELIEVRGKPDRSLYNTARINLIAYEEIFTQDVFQEGILIQKETTITYDAYWVNVEGIIIKYRMLWDRVDVEGFR